MPSAWTQNFYHSVFSTKHRAPMITPEVEARLYPFIGGIVRDMRCTLVAINGVAGSRASPHALSRGPVAFRSTPPCQIAVIEMGA